MNSPHTIESFSRLRLLLATAVLSLCAFAHSTSVSLQITGGPVYVLDLREFATAGSEAAQPCAPFSQVAGVLRQLDTDARWISDARLGLLRIEVADQRFSLSSTRAVMIVNDRIQGVSGPFRIAEGETWIPIDSLHLIVSALDNLSWGGTQAISLGGAFSTTSTIVHSPEEAIRDSILPNGSVLPGGGAASTASLLNIPPPELTAAWRVIIDPVIVEDPSFPPEVAAAIRPSLAQIADRCASVLRDEGSLQPLVLTEHSEATSPDAIMASLNDNPADLAVFLRLESSPLRTAPGYSILYMDDSVETALIPVDAASTDSIARTPPRKLAYRSHQSDNQRLAMTTGAFLAKANLHGFRDRRILPTPLYLLKRSPVRSILILFSFPEGSSELSRLADSGFREAVARQLAEAFWAFRRDTLASAGRVETGGLFP